MSIFAVIRINMDVDHIESTECVQSFQTQEEAELFVQSASACMAMEWQARSSYIDRYVDGLIVPEGLSFMEWKEYINKNYQFIWNVTQDRFRERLKHALKMGHPLPNEDYKPPSVSYTALNLYVVEIQEPQQ